MLSNSVVRRLVQLPRQVCQLRMRSNALNIEKIEAESATDDLEAADEETQQREAKLEKSRNKSRLLSQHANIVNGRTPYTEPKFWSHQTVKYQRKLYGKYGANATNFNPSLCWSKEELALKQEYERIAYPHTIQELIETSKAKRQARTEMIHKRQLDIQTKMEKSEMWKEELYKKLAKKETEALVAKERKDKLIDEVRRHFGYTIDPRDERFKEMMDKKEKEQKKAMKDARKKEKEEVMMAKLTAKGKDAVDKGKLSTKKSKDKESEEDDDTTTTTEMNEKPKSDK